MTALDPAPDDAGFTLVELMVAILLLSILMTGVLASVMSTSGALDNVRATSDITGEARVAMERMSRELRQAERLLAATPSSFSLEGDFNHDGLIADADNERVTYTFDGVAGELVLTTTASLGSPILAGRVSSCVVDYTSSLWEHDADDNGETTYLEIDQAIGNGNGILDLPEELEAIDLVDITLTVSRSGRTQTFTTSTNLRNRSYELGQPSPDPTA
jgi:prepilin-type N-terminal cleavage/methylation domain-containing protein